MIEYTFETFSNSFDLKRIMGLSYYIPIQIIWIELLHINWEFSRVMQTIKLSPPLPISQVRVHHRSSSHFRFIFWIFSKIEKLTNYLRFIKQNHYKTKFNTLDFFMKYKVSILYFWQFFLTVILGTFVGKKNYPRIILQ